MAVNVLPDQRVFLKRGDDRTEMLISQVNVSNLRRAFHVDPKEVWLKDDMDGTGFFPDEESGSFRGLTPWQTLLVEGPPVAVNDVVLTASGAVAATPGPSRAVTLSGVSSGTSAGTSYSPNFRSVLAKKQPLTPTTAGAKVKVVKAIVEWGDNKPHFNKLQQIFIEVDESTATVEYIKQKRWGDTYTLVTADGLELDSESAAQGLSFWKSPRRIIYAVLRSKLLSIHKQKKKSVQSFDESDDDDFEVTPKKKRRIDDIMCKVEKVGRDVNNLKGLVTEIVAVSKEMKVPFGLMKMMRTNFKCKICHRIPLCPPIIISKCCKVIRGCESCVNKWYSNGQSQCCPSCGSERAYNETMILKGLDDFLTDIKAIIQTSEEQEEEDNPPPLPPPLQ